MVSRRTATRIGVVAGVSAVASAFGPIAPAQAYTCDTTIAPTKANLVGAISDGHTIICITAGTMNMGLGAIGENGPILVDDDVTLVGIGDVVIDGNDEAPSFLLGASETDTETNITIDNLTVTDFHDWDYNEYEWGVTKNVPLVGLHGNSAGTVTVLNSTFSDNNTYLSVVGAIDQETTGPTDQYGNIVIDNSVFEANISEDAVVWGYGNVTISNTRFTDNSTANGIVETYRDDESTDGILTFTNNLVEGTISGGSLLNLESSISYVSNNSFVDNSSESSYGAILKVTYVQSAHFAFNTVTGTESSGGADLWTEDGNSSLRLLGNIFAGDSSAAIHVGDGASVVDHGGNFSTADDAAALDSPSSQSNVDVADLALGELADNGGPTATRALGADSIAVDVASAEEFSELFDYALDTDQRGFVRTGDLLDAGAFQSDGYDPADDGEEYLAATGVDGTSIAVIGGVIGAAGVALVSRRRRKA